MWIPKFLICFLFSVCSGFRINAQEATLYQFCEKQFGYYNYPLQIVSQNDSSVTVLSEVESTFGKDLSLTKYVISDTQAVFERRLYVDTLFDGNFNNKEINFHFFENNGMVAFVVEKKIRNKTIIYGKTISDKGKTSNFIALDSIEKQDRNLESFNYIFSQTSNKKNIIVVCRKNYLSGFRRDKCMLFSTVTLDKNLEIDLPKNSISVSENYNFDTDFQNNLFYGVFNKYGFLTDDSLIIFKVELKTKLISRFKVTNHHILTNFKPLFSNQILFYGISTHDIDDKNLNLKAIFFQKVNLNTNEIIMDTTIFLSAINQSNLSYSYKVMNSDPLYKFFTMISDDIIDGHLISVYEHKHHSLDLNDLNRQITYIDPNKKSGTITENLEYLVSSFNLATNQLDFVTLIPKKIIYNSNRYEQTEINPFSSIYFNGDINLSFYENRANIKTIPNQPYKFNSLNQVSNLNNVNTVNYTRDNKKLISFNLRGDWKPLTSSQTKMCNKMYYFNYTKHYIGIAYYKLTN